MNKDATCRNTQCFKCPFRYNQCICSFVLKYKYEVKFSKIIDELSKEIEDIKRKMNNE